MDSNLENNIDLSDYCETHDYCLLDIDGVMKTLYEAGRELSKTFNITQEKIDKALKEIREEEY
jgi:hypothetical protein